MSKSALALCPTLPELVREMVVMGGVFGFAGQCGNVSPVAEANIAGHPAAADAVFVSGMPLTVVGLDVTARTRMDDSFIHQLRERAGDAGEFIYQTTRVYFDFYEQSGGSRDCPIHDSSAAACLLAPSLYRTLSRVVRSTWRPWLLPAECLQTLAEVAARCVAIRQHRIQSRRHKIRNGVA